ncbi:RING finger protein 17-like isoform X2 [Dendropsophus ebraccatus]
METLTITCPLCEVSETEDVSIQSEIPVQLLENVDSNTSVKDKSGSKMKHTVNENNVVHVMDTGNPTYGDCQDNLSLKIDEALIIANDTLHYLNSTFQTLKEMRARNKQVEKHIYQSVHDTFGKLSLALRKRKADVLTDLKFISEVYAVELQNAIHIIEEQKKCLDTRVAFAEGLKMSPSLTMYCDLNQLVADLKKSFKNEGILDSLKGSADIRFTIDYNMVQKVFDNLGTISSASSPNCQSASSGNVAFNESQSLDVKSERKNSEVQPEDCAEDLEAKQYESDLGYMEIDEHNMETTSQLSSEKYLYNSQELNLQSMSTPDVIIEEIIEEDQSCFREPQSNTGLDCTKEKLGFREPQSNTALDCTKEKLEFSLGKPKRFKKSQKMTGTCAPFFQKRVSQELVFLSHWENPCNFYVRRFSQRKQFILLDRMLMSLSRSCSQCLPSDVLELGEIIAFKSIKQKKWCRGNIIQLIPLESKCVLKPCGPTRYKVEDITRLTLFLLDYGGIESFVVERFAGSCLMKRNSVIDCETKVTHLHTILIKLSSAEVDSIRFMPPIAVHCSLDIVPQSPTGMWGKEIRDHVLKVIGAKCVSMKVFREEHRKLIVDLKTPFENKINSDMPLSLREALVFLELAKFPANVSAALSHSVTRYPDPILPEDMTDAFVIVCHINSPSDFYIHLVCESEYADTIDKIQGVYNSKEADDLRILHPVVGQPCVAKFISEDDHWYRAEIKALCNNQEAIIKYVDFGNTTTVDIAALRSMKKEFMTTPCKAIGCRLAYIQPPNVGPSWSPEACRLFDKLTAYKHLRCTSIGILLENKLSVELLDINVSHVTSINTMLVEERVATFIESSSSSAEPHLPLKEVWDPVIETSPEPVEITMDNISLFKRRELDVFISHVVSPSKIYVQWLTTENILKSLQAAMFDRYENSEPEDVPWQVDMKVAVHLRSDKQWMRGKVINIISDSLVEVFCYDFGKQEVADVTNLRILDESFMVYGTMCLECALMDIQPAGGSQNWTATACDFLSHYLNGATVTIIIEDNASQWPLPVRILSANEANQMVDVSEFLVKRGLALRDRKNKPNAVLKPNEATSTTPPPAESGLQEQDPVEDIASESKPECDTSAVECVQSDITGEEEPVIEPMVDNPYLPPLLPDKETFSAKVHHVADDGTIYVVQECLESELSMLMVDIQNSFKCLGLLAPYSWKKGEGCLIKGSDTMSYRGKVLDILSGDLITVKYEDFGYTEKIPKCHLYPSVFNPHVPAFCIPCQLIDICPVGDCWQPDAIVFLKELLLERVVTVHILEPPDSQAAASVRIYCGGTSVSTILEQYAYGIPKGCEKNDKLEMHKSEKIWCLDFQVLLQNNLGTPILPKYSTESLPRPGELFKVEVTHLQTPNEVFILVKKESESDTDPLRSILKEINSEEREFPFLTDFRTAMPCLATYRDGLLHRAKLQSIKGYDPVTCVVEFVDYGNTSVLDAYSLFQLPPLLMLYPAKAIKVKLAGFKPPKKDFEDVRIVYCPEWSMRALYDMVDLVEKKILSASCVTGSENTVFLYDENHQLIHKPLIARGLAEVDEM